MKKATWFIFLLIIIASCLNDPDCFRINSNVIGISFRVMGTGKSDTLRMYGVTTQNTDSTFYRNTAATGIGIPLDFTTTESEYLFQTTRGDYSIALKYDVNVQFVSEDCGSKYVLENLETTGHTFDSIRLVSRTPGTTAGGNIEIFRCPRTDTMAVAFRQLTLSGTTKSSQALVVETNGITPDFTGETLYGGEKVSIVYLPVNLDVDKHAMVIDFDQVEGGLRKLDLNYTLTETQRYRPCGVQIFASEMIINAVESQYAFDSVGFVLNETNSSIRSVLDPFDPMINIYRCPDLDIAGIYFRNRQDRADSTVSLKSVTVNFQTTNYAPTEPTTFIRVPLNKSATNTTVTIEYQTGKIETLVLSYTATPITRFRVACSDQNTLFTNLAVVAQGTTLVGSQVPNASLQSIPTRNIEIFP
ncbi:DUF6452 family protein [Pseudochryseolinea flava]|uniref:Uncharacterized protein n=1 Tax=Pseudochryseolinea flava TaxID=2059302 RepID=A0A364YAG9_9BACT|nr:DUF6452 family protein [Pseudochryseolinea flava]RAW03319.1 hypothetical protein DQQ10_04335 [Pseudochryseolinea flava]